ncbi:hypothetical protein AUTU_08140 [Aureibacter tunicatorum]|nr:hypothetical protein AUTU_08140 [Aureibacter tunicatorum]
MGAPYWYGTIGYEYSISQIVEDLNVNILAQGIFQRIHYEEEVSSTNFNHIFQEASMLRVEFSYQNSYRLILSHIYDYKIKHYLFQPEFEANVIDGLSLGLRADIMEGPIESLWGKFSNNRIQFRAKYHF